MTHYARKIARYKCLEKKKKLKQQQRTLPESTFNPYEEKEKKNDKNQIQKVIKGYILELPAKCRVPLILKYYHDMKYKEIAELLDESTSDIGVYIKRGKERIEKHLKSNYSK